MVTRWLGNGVKQLPNEGIGCYRITSFSVGIVGVIGPDKPIQYEHSGVPLVQKIRFYPEIATYDATRSAIPSMFIVSSDKKSFVKSITKQMSKLWDAANGHLPCCNEACTKIDCKQHPKYIKPLKPTKPKKVRKIGRSKVLKEDI